MNSENSIDEQLHQLALMAKAHPVRSRQRQDALTKICKILQQPNTLTRRRGMSEDAYIEAKQGLMLYICEKIDNYDPLKGCSVLAWANTNFKWRQHDEAVKANSSDTLSLDNLPLGGVGEDKPYKNWEEKISEARLNPSKHPGFISAQVQTLFEEDPDRRFRDAHVKNRPDVTFQRLVLRVFNGDTYKDLSVETGISISTLSSFFQRRLAEFGPYIKDYLMND